MTDGLNHKNTELIDLLTVTNAKLDSIITLLGGLPPSGTKTIDDLWEVMTDIHLDTVSMDQKLLRLVTAICPPVGYTGEVVPMQIRIGDIYDALWDFKNDSAATWVEIMGSSTHLTDNVLNYLRTIGNTSVYSPATVMSRLLAIETNTACACGAMPIDPTTDPDGCSQPFISNSQYTDVAYPDRSFVRWPTLIPEGLDWSDTYDLSAFAEFTASDGLSGWSFYGYSRSAVTFRIKPDDLSDYVIGQWYPLMTNFTIAASVAAGNDLIVYLCPPWDTPPAFDDCVNISGTIGTVTYPEGTSPPNHTRYYIPLGTLGLNMTNTMIIGGASYVWSVGDAVTTDDMIGVKVTLVSGVKARPYWVDTSGGGHTADINTIGGFFIIPGNTTYFGVDNYTDNSVSPGVPITVELCPAA
jgi:hypothetical protein